MDQSEATTQMTKPIKWVIPDFIKTDHATHLVVQQQGSEFTLLFFELQAPVFMGTAEEQLAAFKNLPFTEAKCVAKVVMSVENIALAANNLAESLNRFNELLLVTTKGQENANITE